MEAEQWFRSVLSPLLAGISAPEDSQVVLFSADTDRTQTYVFESNRLPEIRGGSRQIAELTSRAVILGYLASFGLPEECLLFAGGGSILALLPSLEIAEALQKKIEQSFATTGIVTITCVARSFTGEELRSGFPLSEAVRALYPDIVQGYLEDCGQPQNRKHFGETVLLMSMLLRRAKQMRELTPYYEVMPFARLCSSCQKRPANEHLKTRREEEFLCSICAKKRLLGGGGKKKERSYWVDTLRAQLLQAGYPINEDSSYPQDIETLVGEDDLAFIYADGDGIGSSLLRQTTPRAYAHLSYTLQTITQDGVVRALAQDISLYPRADGVLPWEIIAIGGDDVLMLLPAASALQFALNLARSFQTGAAEQGYQLSMSVGVALAKSATPVRVLRDAAYRVLRNAKQRGKIRCEPRVPAIDFHHFVKEGAISGDLTRLRASLYALGDETQLTGRPFSLDEMERLLKSVRTLRAAEFPASQIHSLSAELRAGTSRERGSLYYHYQRARLRPNHRRALIEIEQMWETPNSQEFPWSPAPRGAKYEYQSILPDLAMFL